MASPALHRKTRIPPQSLDAEMAFLGSIMLRPESLYEVLDLVHEKSFYSERHRVIYSHMMDLFGKSQPIDFLSLSNKLREQSKLESAGGEDYLSELANTVPSSANIKHYAEIVQKKDLMRRLIEASEHISTLGFDESGDIEDILDSAEKKVFEVTKNFSSNDQFKALKPLLIEAFDKIEQLASSKGEVGGIPSGFKNIDNLLAGFHKSDLVILAARPSVGKTAFALDVARRTAVQHQTKVGIFSLEMSAEQLVNRILAAQSQVDSWKIRKGLIQDSYEHIRNALDELSRADIFIDDHPGATSLRMRSTARKLKSEKGLDMLIVDYLQLMTPTATRASDSMVQQVTELSRSLKHLARELQIPVMALSQLSRDVEKRGGEPRLSDLRDSGSIEQDADVVMFIHNADMEQDREKQAMIRKDLIVAKHRNGPVGRARFNFDSEKTSFVELDTNDYGGAEKAFDEF